jgi:hypothetical protein
MDLTNIIKEEKVTKESIKKARDTNYNETLTDYW